MRQEYSNKIKEKGHGKRFHSLKDVEEQYVNDLLAWINPSRVERGLDPIEGHTETWQKAKEAQVERIKAFFETSTTRRDSGVGGLPELASCNA